MTTGHKQRAPRVKKKIRAVVENHSGIIENISTSGGFLKLDTEPPTEPFTLDLKISEYKTIQMECDPQWSNEVGVGFKVLSVEETKRDLFKEYVEKQIQALGIYGNERVYRTEIVVTLKDTNVFGNVYFSNFIEYQGVIREKFLLEVVPELHDLMATNSIRLVTVDAYNRYISNAYFGDTLEIRLTTSDIKAATCRLNISFKNKKTGELVGEGYQRFCVVSAKGNVIRLPDPLLGPLNFYHEIKD